MFLLLLLLLELWTVFCEDELEPDFDELELAVFELEDDDVLLVDDDDLRFADVDVDETVCDEEDDAAVADDDDDDCFDVFGSVSFWEPESDCCFSGS